MKKRKKKKWNKNYCFLVAVWSNFFAAFSVSLLVGCVVCWWSGCIEPVSCNQTCHDKASVCNRNLQQNVFVHFAYVDKVYVYTLFLR